MTAVTTSAFDEAAAAIGTTAHLDVPLAPFTTYRAGGRAAVLARPHSVADLERIAGARSATGLPLIVVGKGSNMLVADAGFAGIAVTLADLEMSDGAEQAGFVVVTYGDASEIVVDVPGAASLPSLAPAGIGRHRRVRMGGGDPRLDRWGGEDERRRPRSGHGGRAR